VSNAILFDRDQVERLDALSHRPSRLGHGKLLWVDLDRRSAQDAAAVAEVFDLEPRTTRCLARPEESAVFEDHGHYIHVTAYAPCEGEDGLAALDCVVGERWVITAHDSPIPVLDEFAARASGSGDTGSLDGPSFLAALLEWVLGSYTEAFERIERRLEQFDIQAMRGDADEERDIEKLIEMRQEVGKLRRALAAHRSPLVALTHPELEALGNDASSERFGALLRRFEVTIQEARDAREAIVGSFDVLLARGSQRTNEIMKVLTLASVILLPGALIAGVMGMNFKVGFFDQAALFWVVVAAILAIAPITLGLARQRGWI
jgi:magnesium transporter